MHSKIFSLLTIVAVFFISEIESAHHTFDDEYSFKRELDSSGRYTLHWRINRTTGVIHFAVNVSTEGWVGFGISPNGQMPRSDVVIGWVDGDGTTNFNDRYAAVRATPTIDPQQNWFLTRGEQKDGQTLLEFYRNMTSCDDRDLDIAADTTRVIWSWHSSDPVNGMFQRHQVMGTTSIALLGGLREPRPEPTDPGIFSITNDNVTIPAKDTTYWCKTVRFSEPNITNGQNIYIYKMAPAITEATIQNVHHLVIYLCPPNLPVDVNADCDEGANRQTLIPCFAGGILTAWAIGGEDFVFPENVSLSFNTARTVLVEMHYDNPMLEQGLIDSSGLDVFYTLTPPMHEAASMVLGATSLPAVMLIPPNADNFTYDALCSSTCLDRFLPENGITVFASTLHTHLVGKSLVVQHIRNNSQCGVLEELKPIDSDPNYDFNYQQQNHIPNVQVKRGDSLLLKCSYQTKNRRTGMTFGGAGTRQEMCSAFIFYYPKIDLPFCGHSINTQSAYSRFIATHLANNQTAVQLAMGALPSYNTSVLADAFNQITWNDTTINQLETAVRNSIGLQLCIGNTQQTVFVYPEAPANITCSYEASDKCTGYQPQSCCERIRGVTPTEASAFSLIGSSWLLLFVMMIAFIVGA